MSLNLTVPISGSQVRSAEIRDNISHLYSIDLQHASGSDPHEVYVLSDGSRTITGSQNIAASGSTVNSLQIENSCTVGNVFATHGAFSILGKGQSGSVTMYFGNDLDWFFRSNLDQGFFDISHSFRMRANDLYINYGGPDGNSAIYFYEGDSASGASIIWSDSLSRFQIDQALDINGTLQAGSGSRLDSLTLGNDGDLSLKAYGNIFSSGGIRAAGSLVAGWNKDSSTDDAYLAFCNTNAKYLHWDAGDSRFEFDDDLFVSGQVIADSGLRLNIGVTNTTITPDAFFLINLNGTVYRVPCIQDPV